MKRRFLTLLLTLVFIMPISVNAEEQVIHNWTTPDSEQTWNDPLTGYASKYASKGGSAADRWNPSLYYATSSGGASVSVSTDLLNAGEEMNVTSWIEAISDKGRVSAPSKDGVRTNKTEHDWKGRPYYHDSKRVYAPDEDIYADAVTSYQAHPVAVYYDNDINPHFPVGDTIERSFYHSAWASAWASDENSPSGLPEFDPYGTGSLDVTSRSSLNLTVNSVTFTTP